ncbi:MAG: molybdate ABC transporter substrate-binding protein [Gammaproteobacteria bacterium]|nr:molybdate ABC transporter substrate-binding protein [Gammaproteobacteria bacterium]
MPSILRLRRSALAAIVCALAVLWVSLAAAGVRDDPLIAAASDLRFALEEIAARFERETGQGVRLTFGSSGSFARQIEQGAGFEMFLSADEELVFRLADKGLTKDRGALYAIGRLALVVPAGSPVSPSGDLTGLRAALAAHRVKRFAIANPEHAPYGRAAEEALRHAGLWEPLRPHLVFGENVSQAAQFAVADGSQGGLIAGSLALAPSMQGRGRFALVPASWHRPLRQRMVLLRDATPAAGRFHAYVLSDAGREIMKRYGFELPAG